MSCTIRATYCARTWISWKKQNGAQLTVMEKNTVKLLHYHTQCVLTLKISRISSIPPPSPPPPLETKNPVSPQFFLPNYPVSWSLLGLLAKISFSAKGHGQVLLYNVRYFFSAVRGRHRTVSAVCLFSQETMTRVFWVFLFSSSVESGRTVVVSENYLLLVAFVEFWIDDRESFGDLNPDLTTGFNNFS